MKNLFLFRSTSGKNGSNPSLGYSQVNLTEEGVEN